MAAKGSIELPNLKLKNIMVAAVDENGCSVFKQEINGTATSPEIGKLKSLFGEVFSSIGDLIDKGKKVLGSKCKPFYHGSVKH